jgi:hypothetical protein
MNGAMLIRFIENHRFFFPSEPLAESLLEEMKNIEINHLKQIQNDPEQIEAVERSKEDLSPSQEKKDHHSVEEKIHFLIRLIAEELYYHLALLARSPFAKGDNAIPIRAAIIPGMGNMLGIPEDSQLLAKLASEFTEWINERGEFTAGWGSILLGKDNTVYLREVEIEGERKSVSESKFFVKYPPGHRKQEESSKPQAQTA